MDKGRVPAYGTRPFFARLQLHLLGQKERAGGQQLFVRLLERTVAAVHGQQSAGDESLGDDGIDRGGLRVAVVEQRQVLAVGGDIANTSIWIYV